MKKSVKQIEETKAAKDKEEALQLMLEIEQFNRERQEEITKATIAYYQTKPVLDFNGVRDAEMAIVPEFLRKIAAAWPSMQLALQVCMKNDDVWHQHVTGFLTAVPVWNPPKPDPDRGVGNMRVFKMELEKIRYSIPEPEVFRAHVVAAWEAYREVAKLRKKVEELESSLRMTDYSKFFRFSPPFSGCRG